MSGRCLLGVDIGTFSSKGMLVREDGQVVAQRIVEHSLDIPGPGRAEHDPDKVWWRDFLLICSDLMHDWDIDANAIAAVGISTISPAIVVVDDAGRALRPAILYGIDTRATQEITELQGHTGAKLSTQSASPKVMWIRRNEPEVWARTRFVLNGSGYLNLRLTGECTIDVYDASAFAPFFDTDALRWSPDLAPIVAPVEMMPRPTWTCEIVGHVTPEAARETGLAEGTPVITGTADAAAEAVSAGLGTPGDMMVMYGSSTFFILRTETLRTPRGFWASRFVEKDTYVVAGGTATAGSLTRWFRDNFAIGELLAERNGGVSAYTVLGDLASGSPPGARGLVALPYFSGERTPVNDPHARGVLFGLTLGHGRADVYRALLESVGYAIRHNIEALAAESCMARKIIAVGGGSLNQVWMQIVSDIAGITQEMHMPQLGASYGDAFLAGIGVGMFSSTRDMSHWTGESKLVIPRGDIHHVYGNYYRIYRELYERNAVAMHDLARLSS